MIPSQVVLRSTGNLRGNRLTVDFIDVGQGNAVLVTYPNGATMLVDCGSQSTSLSKWPYTHVSSYIDSVVGTNAIDCVVLSHPDDDHCVFIPHIAQAATPTYLHFGGSIVSYSQALQTYIHSRENRRGVFVYRYPGKGYSNVESDADFGTATTAGEAHVMVLGANFGKKTNDKSIVLMIRYGQHSVILPGDAEQSTEDVILSKVPKTMLSGATVLMPAHHGAFEATGDEWAKTLKPGISVISASGANIGYAHPACMTNAVLEFYAVNCEDHTVTCSDRKSKPYKRSDTTKAVLVTATQGDVRFVSDGTNFRLLASSLTSALVAPRLDPTLAGMVSNAPWNQPPARPVAVPDRPEPALEPILA